LKATTAVLASVKRRQTPMADTADEFDAETYVGGMVAMPRRLCETLEQITVDLAGVYQIDALPFELYSNSTTDSASAPMSFVARRTGPISMVGMRRTTTDASVLPRG
jgi:hypothetical protein